MLSNDVIQDILLRMNSAPTFNLKAGAPIKMEVPFRYVLEDLRVRLRKLICVSLENTISHKITPDFVIDPYSYSSQVTEAWIPIKLRIINPGTSEALKIEQEDRVSKIPIQKKNFNLNEEFQYRIPKSILGIPYTKGVSFEVTDPLSRFYPRPNS